MKALPFLCCLIRPSATKLRVTIWELAILAGHLLLYPTGLSQEQRAPVGDLIPSRDDPGGDDGPGGGDDPGGDGHAAERDELCLDAHPGSPVARLHASAGPRAAQPQNDVAQDGVARDDVPQDDVRASASAPACAGSRGSTGAPASGGRPEAARTARPTTLPAAPRSAEGRPHAPVLLLHGFIDNRSVFVLLRRSLRRHGWRHLEALNYSPLTCDIRKAAELLGRHVEEVCRRTGHRRIDMVGHSLGGLIARYYVQCLGGDARIRTLVTLGTPHGGTRLASLLPAHPLVRQMRTDSDVIKELARPAPHCRTRFVCFWSDLDQMMVPVETAKIDHADLDTRSVHVSGVGHLAFPVNGVVAAGIREALAAEEPASGKPAAQRADTPQRPADPAGGAPGQASVA